MERKELNGLLQKVSAGDEDAFCALYNGMYKGIFSFIYSFVKDYAESEDLTQDCFMKIRYNVNKYEVGNPSAWILQIAKNLALDYIKEVGRKATVDIDDYAVAAKERTDDKMYLHDVMAETLDETSRQIVLLHVEQGYKHREIADFLGMPLGTVLWKYNQAMKTLKEKLEEE